MQSATWKFKVASFLVLGPLVLAGVFADVRFASAQTRQECPLPAGVTTPPAGPEVTAQQVENGSASLREFALAAKDRYLVLHGEATDFAGLLYIQCLTRQEESAWRSGSTYLVYLTPDGKVFQHAKSMALSDRQLNPVIYGAILQALGINPSGLTDPAAARAAFTAAAAGNGGSFDAPDVPGASGYAIMFAPHVIWLAGFDLGEAHLVPIADQDIAYGDPSVTARDVVDRESLKAFVIEAEKQVKADVSPSSTVRLAFRDENGPWRHGSVYLYILDTTSNLIVFHAAFPDRFELQPLVPTVRDAVTGEFILPQVIEAARSSPEGGFVEYYFDDPTDDADSADIPKVGYAREFTLAGLSARPQTFIIGSGFYLSSPNVVAARRNTAVKSVLPQVLRAMTASTVDAVSGRIERATSDTAPATEVSLGGASTLSDALLANGHALGNGTLDFNRLLAGSSFTMTLNAAGGGSGPFGNLTLWGSGDYRSISGGSPQSVDYDGSVTSANLGIDTRLGADIIAGLAVSRARGTVDYTGSYALKGELTTSLTSVNPYVGRQTAGGMNLWAMAGFGSGEVDDESADAPARDLTQRMVAAGVSGPLVSSDKLIGGGTTNLNLKGEVAYTWAKVDASGALAAISLSASRQRLMLEGAHVHMLASGATFTPSLELGLRNDGGDGETGAGVEAVGALRYEAAESWLTVEGRVRTLLSHSGDYEETGVSGLVRIAPGASGRGLALSVEPAWGRTASGVQRLWESGVTAGASADNRARLNAEVGYGLGAPRGLGVVTPYAGLGLAGDGARLWRVGTRWQVSAYGSASLEGTCYEAASGDGPGHGLMLRVALRW